jgi:hypothetical protein
VIKVFGLEFMSKLLWMSCWTFLKKVKIHLVKVATMTQCYCKKSVQILGTRTVRIWQLGLSAVQSQVKFRSYTEKFRVRKIQQRTVRYYSLGLSAVEIWVSLQYLFRRVRGQKNSMADCPQYGPDCPL